MIRLPRLSDYFKKEITDSQGVIRNIFLSNAENEIIETSGPLQEAAILSTLLNDSLYIIRLPLLEGQQSKKNQASLEIQVAMGDRRVFLFSIRNLVIIGIIVEEKCVALGHKMAEDIVKFVTDELQNMAEWSENNDVF